jgi:hypothetical protein
MADPVASVEKIVKIGLRIKEAVDTVRRNEEVCREIRQRVLRFSAILSQLQRTGMLNDDNPAMSGALEDLEETLGHALDLVAACQGRGRSAVHRLITAGSLSVSSVTIPEAVPDPSSDGPGPGDSNKEGPREVSASAGPTHAHMAQSGNETPPS